LFFGFLSCRMPYVLCWVAHSIFGPRRRLENDAFPSWHFARSNEVINLESIPCKKGKSGYRYERPLLSYFHSPKLDPESSVVPTYLCCVARTISLVAESDFEREKKINLRLVGSKERPDGQVEITSRSVGLMQSSLGSLSITYDHTWETQYDRRTWTLLPVYVSGHLTTQENLYCSGLLLEQVANGDCVRKGAFSCGGGSTACDVDVLLEALGKARPRFVMIA
jgi:hypothetical protein